MTNTETAIEEVLDNFDFEKVKKAIVAVGWAQSTVEEMRKTCRSLLEYALNLFYREGLNQTVYSCGFKVSVSSRSLEKVSLSLEFIAVRSTSIVDAEQDPKQLSLF